LQAANAMKEIPIHRRPQLAYASELLLILCLFLSSSCSSDRSASRNSSPARPYAYTAKVTNGQVFLVLNANPAAVIGPFVRNSDGHYSCETRGEGVRSLTRSADGQWTYSWSHIMMRGEPVDATALTDK